MHYLQAALYAVTVQSHNLMIHICRLHSSNNCTITQLNDSSFAGCTHLTNVQSHSLKMHCLQVMLYVIILTKPQLKDGLLASCTWSNNPTKLNLDSFWTMFSSFKSCMWPWKKFITSPNNSLHTAVMQCGTLTLNNVHKTAIFNMDVCHSDPAVKCSIFIHFKIHLLGCSWSHSGCFWRQAACSDAPKPSSAQRCKRHNHINKNGHV